MSATPPFSDDSLVNSQLWWSQPLFLCALLVAVSFLPLIIFHDNAYLGNADIHAVMEMCGSLTGLIAGLAIISRFYALGDRLHLFIGLAFIVNGSEDFVHGFLGLEAAHHAFNAVEKSAYLERYIPGTYVTGRLLFGVILILAPILSSRMSDSPNPRKETFVVSLITLVTTVALTAVAFAIPLPEFIYADYFISRPVDFIAAIVIGTAFFIHYSVYRRSRDQMHIWILIAIAIDFSGQLIMSFSSQLFDMNFDLAHVYKLIGYAIPLIGFCVYHIQIIKGIEANKNELLQLTRQLEAAREEAVSLAQKAQQASLAKSSFLATMSHELRTPLNAILGFTRRLLKKAEKDIHPQHLDALWSINRNGQNLRELIDTILDLSKIEAGKMTYHITEFDIRGACQESVRLLEPLASAKGLALKVAETGPPVLRIEADHIKFGQVITNLVSNAIKYTKEGGVLVSLAVDSEDPAFVSIRVSDSGIGINSEDKKLLFKRFQQLHSSFDRKVGGTGLGLVLTSEFIVGHNGTIAVDSVVDEGSTFVITLPRRQN